MQHAFLIVLILVSSHLSIAQTKRRGAPTCSVAGQTEAGDLAIVCRQISSGTCYRLAGSIDTGKFSEGTAVWMDFEHRGIRVSKGNGSSVTGLQISKTIPLNSRQWPWFGPVSEMVCRAGMLGDTKTADNPVKTHVVAQVPIAIK